MKTFNVIKKNRKYFAAEVKNGYKCRILIDKNSEDLELGIHELEVDDISVKSKYGVDLIFKLKGSVKEQQQAGIVTLKTPGKNERLISRCRDLGGKWDKQAKVWVFNGMIEDEVEKLDEMYNSDPVPVEITFKDELFFKKRPAIFLGFHIAAAVCRDGGAKLSEGISLINGSVGSGGSSANWGTIIDSGTVIRMMIPYKLIENGFERDDIELKKL